MPLFSLGNQNDENRKNDKSDTIYHNFCNYVYVIVENVEIFLWFSKSLPVWHTPISICHGVSKRVEDGHKTPTLRAKKGKAKKYDGA
jgi:hypothetical protein